MTDGECLNVFSSFLTRLLALIETRTAIATAIVNVAALTDGTDCRAEGVAVASSPRIARIQYRVFNAKLCMLEGIPLLEHG